MLIVAVALASLLAVHTLPKIAAYLAAGTRR